MFPAKRQEAPTCANIAHKVCETPRKERPDGELRQNSTDNPGEPLDTIDDSLHHKLEARLSQTAKRRYRIKGAATLLSKTFTGLRHILDQASSARNRTMFSEDKQQRRAVTDMLHSDLDPWHEYEQLASDSEDDYPNPQSPERKTMGTKFNEWVGRLTTAVEDSLAAQTVLVRTLR
ncbi:hypothetical protein F4803DRAFT_540769 [Xylaria telfairii]|nr:hypothetical protein F4803DRAFT_540769 [Xylaria telfairii]